MAVSTAGCDSSWIQSGVAIGAKMTFRRPLFRFKTVRRELLTKEIERQLKRLRHESIDVLLDIGAKYSPYKSSLPCRTYMTLDIDPATRPDILSDVHEVEWESNYFDAILATEVLEHLYDPQRAINQFWRLLKPGGICIISVPFIYHYHPDPYDYFRYTKDGLLHLLSSFSHVEIIPHGNRFQAVWLLISGSKKTLGLLSWLNPIVAKLGTKGDSTCPLGFVVWAVK